MSFSFFVLFKQDKIPLPLVCVWIPTDAGGFKAPLVGLIQLPLIVLLALCIDPIAKLDSIFFMILWNIAVAFSFLKSFKQSEVPLPLV